MVSVFVLQIDGVETKFLSANSISEFSHGLGHSRPNEAIDFESALTWRIQLIGATLGAAGNK